MKAERHVTGIAHVALIWSLVYLAWRALFTLSGADATAATLLFGAEVLAVAVFAARTRSALAPPIDVVASPDAPLPDTAAVVDATGSSVDELRTTLLALRRVVGVERIVVVDGEGARWLRTVAERLGATVGERSLTFDDAVRGAGTSWVLILRSGDLPMPDLVSVCAPRCSAPEVAVIQVGVEEADPTSFGHDPDAYWSLEPYVQEVVRPSLAARGSIPWYGDGPALVRRSAIMSTQGPGLGQMFEGSRVVGLEIIAMGMTITHLPLTLARVRGPHGLGESLVRRHGRTRSALGSLRSPDFPRVDGPARVAHLLALTPLVGAMQRLLLIGAALTILGLSRTPMSASLLGLAVLAVPSYLLRWTAHLLLGRGRLGPFSILRSDLRSLGVDLLPFGRVREDAGRAGLVVLAGAVAALVAAIVVAAFEMWRGGDGQLPTSVVATTFVVVAGFLGVATEVLLDAMARRQRRGNQRVRLGLVTCRIEELDGQLVDLSTGGAGVVVAAPLGETFEIGAVTTLSFRIPDADGAWRSVSTLVHVAHRSEEPDGGTRLGLSFDDPMDAPLDPVVEFLTIDRRLVALGRHESMAR
jgi:PilZ domain